MYANKCNKLCIGPYKMILNHSLQEHWDDKFVKIAENEQQTIKNILKNQTILMENIKQLSNKYNNLNSLITYYNNQNKKNIKN